MNYERYEIEGGEVDLINGVVVAVTLGLGKYMGMSREELPLEEDEE